jgi:hypothetical protein
MKSILVAFIVGLFALISTCNSQTLTVGPLGWDYGYVEVSSLTPTLTLYATNYTSPPSLTPPIDLYIRYLALPTQTMYDAMTGLTNNGPIGPGNSVTFPSGVKPDVPYYFAFYNGSVLSQDVSITSNVGTITVIGVPEPHYIAFGILIVVLIIVIQYIRSHRKW